MKMEIINLNEEETEDIETRLEKYDEQHINFKLLGNVSLGSMSCNHY